MTEDRLNNKTPWQDLTIGGDIYEAGNAKEFKTGDWRSITPVYKPEVCKQCGLCCRTVDCQYFNGGGCLNEP